jgi:flagellin
MTMLSINTNIGALNSSQSSYSVNKSMEESMARLSSGKRINSGADDAAGLFITKRMAGEIQGLNQAVRNAADAQAYLATTEGAMEEIHTILLRMRELAVQGSNGTYTTQDIRALRTEIVDLQAEIDRISDDTTFNNIGVLSGAASNGITFQIGADNTQTMTVSIQNLSTTALGLSTISTAGTNLTTAAQLMVYISTIDTAISTVSTRRGTYAAAMNRLDHAIANMQNVASNLAAAKGRVEDADFAAETSNLARVQVLQQASMAMLAQANASKQNILSLFQ